MVTTKLSFRYIEQTRIPHLINNQRKKFICPGHLAKKHNKYERNMFVLQGEFLRLTQDTDFKITMILSKELMEVKEAINFSINLNS